MRRRDEAKISGLRERREEPMSERRRDGGSSFSSLNSHSSSSLPSRLTPSNSSLIRPPHPSLFRRKGPFFRRKGQRKGFKPDDHLLGDLGSSPVVEARGHQSSRRVP